jgi:hypothetical protein
MALNKKHETKHSSTPSYKEIQAIRDKDKANHMHAKKTKSKYRGYIRQGRKFLADMITEMTSSGDKDQFDDEIDLEQFAKAFTEPGPNKYSVQALEAFLVQKCLKEGCGVSTRDGIHAAFKRHWEDM